MEGITRHITILIAGFFLGILLVRGMKALLNKYRTTVRVKRSGRDGEALAYGVLKSLDKSKYKILKNIKVKHQEFDFIIIGPSGIYNIEVKHYTGENTRIIIDKNGNWFKEKYGNKFPLENPTAQTQRHRSVLDSIFKGEVPIIDLLVLSNGENKIEQHFKLPYRIVPLNTLEKLIKDKREKVLTKDKIDEITKRLLSYS
jgi:hypothetical protein